MTTPIESFTVNEGTDKFGSHRSTIFQDDEIVFKQTFDAEPIMEMAKAERDATAGERWGDGRKVGTIPMPIYNQILQKYKGREEREYAILCWLKANQNFVTFEKFLKP